MSFGASNSATASMAATQARCISPPVLVKRSTDDFTISEGSGHIDISVTRAGDASGTATVNFNTFDESQPDHGSQKSDYEIAVSKLTCAPFCLSRRVRT